MELRQLQTDQQPHGTGAVLAGLRVVDLSNLRTGAQASQVFADFGADVIHVEPRGGSPLRAEAAWPYWARGKRSVELDLRDPEDLAVTRRLARSADVLIETFRPGVADRLGLGYEALSKDNPRLVYGSVTGFGSSSPYAHLQGYEGVVISKVGVPWALAGMAGRAGPAFPTAAYASYPASQLLIQAILAALYERESSGVGQQVETSLLRGLTVHDVFNLISRIIAGRFSDAFKQTPRVVDGVPTGGLSFRLLTALSKDGRWMQFSQTPERLFRAMMRMFGLDWMYDDPKWSTAPDFDDAGRREEFWEHMLNAVRARTAAEWAAEFDRDPDVWGELFYKGSEVLRHPQMVYGGFVAEVRDPELGTVRELGPIVRLSRTPANVSRPAPSRLQHQSAITAEAGGDDVAGKAPLETSAPKGRLPLEGVTIVELSTFYASPYGATLLAEMGARVIKLEALEGDPHRTMLPFPELAAIKALQGKECVAVNLKTPEGQEIAHRVIKSADMILQSFRAGAAKRLGVDYETLRKLNPDVIYHVAAGYGDGGPCGHRPSFAPTIGAAAGLAWRNAGSTIPDGPDLSLEQIKAASIQMGTAVLGVGNADGLSAVTVASALMLSLFARRRGMGGQEALTTMVSSAANALSEMIIEYEGRPDPVAADRDLYGLSALYRLYETAQEWVFLAAPSEREWKRLVAALTDGPRLERDARFATAQSRRANDADLADELGKIFRGGKAADWEARLLAADVACVVVARDPVEANYLDEGSLGRQCGLMTTSLHKMLDEMPRVAPLVSFSRSATVAGDAGILGEHTQKVLLEFGYSSDEIKALADRGIVITA